MSTAPQSASPIFSSISRNLTDLLLRAVKQHPEHGLILETGEGKLEAPLVPYPALLDEAARILGGLRHKLKNPAAKVALLLEQPRDFIPAFWACVLGDYVPCPMVPIRNDFERWNKHLANVDELLDHPLFVTIGQLKAELPASITSVDLDDLRTHAPHHGIATAKSTDCALLVLTSGSTGNSKAVALTHGNVLASMACKAESQEMTSDDVTLNWISFDHVAALLETHMLPLYLGATQVHIEPAAILADPLLFLRLIGVHRVTMTFTPNFLLAQISSALQASAKTRYEQHPLDLSCVRHIISGGEAIVVETGQRFLELLTSHGLHRKALWPAFGMTETCAGCIYSRKFPEGDCDREFAALGLTVRGLQMRIVDDRGDEVTAGQAGELQLRGPMIFSHYHNNVQATAAAFTPDGWFRSGDLGRIDEGALTLVGRNKDSIIVNGVNYFSHELETALEQLDGIERSYVAAFPTRPTGAETEQLVVMFATTLPHADEEKLYQLLSAVRNTTIMLWGFRPAIALSLPKSAFPKTSLGKIQRTLLRRRLENGEFDEQLSWLSRVIGRHLGPHTSPAGPLERTLAETFSQMFGIEVSAVSTTVSFFDLGGTSLDILKLTRSLEDRFKMKTALPIVLQNPTVRELALRVSEGFAAGGGKYDPIVPLQVTGRGTPLFCVHPGNGEILVLTNLAKYFVNERPFYALRPRGFSETHEPFDSFDEMVGTYLDAILERQPTGPYAIAGYSLGAPIAFELAKRLEVRGERVAFLGSIDGAPCEREPPFDRIDVATGLGIVLDLIDRDRSAALQQQLRTTLSDQDPCACVIQAASRGRLADLDLDVTKYSAWVRVAHALENILRAHTSSGTVRAMDIFYSAGFPAYFATQEWHDRIRRWNSFVTLPQYTEIPGDHYTLMAPKHVAAFQDILRARLNRALGESGGPVFSSAASSN